MRRRQQCTRQRERDAKQTKSCASALAEFAADVLATTRVRGVAKMLKRGRRVAKQKDITRTKQGLLQLKAQTRASRVHVARHKHHQSKGVQLTLGQQLDIAHSPLHNSFDAMAQVYLSHRTTIARTLLVQGEFEITAQLKLMEKLEGWCTETEPDLELAAGADMYDETGQKLSMVVKEIVDRTSGMPMIRDSGEAPGEQPSLIKARVRTVRSTMDVQAARFVFQWKVRGDDSSHCCFEFISHPSTLASCSARNMWGALRSHPTMARYRSCKKALLDRASQTGLSFDIDHGDDASGNDLYFAAACCSDNPKWIKDKVKCFNHQNHHCFITLIVAVVGMTVVSNLFSLAVYLSLGTYFLRCALALPHYLAKPGIVKVEFGHVPPDDALYVDQLIAYLLLHFKGPPSARVKYEQKLHRLFRVLWNGGFHVRGCIVHYCSGAGCVCGGTIKNLIVFLDQAMLPQVYIE